MLTIPNEIKLPYEVGEYIFHGYNEQTGLFAVEWLSGNTITLYILGKQDPTPRTNMSDKSWIALRSVCKTERRDTTMYRYGKSKVVHYGMKCAKANASHVPTTISLLDAALEGYAICKNCYYRNRCMDI